MSEKRIIAYLAEKCLNEKGQEAVAEFLSDNKIDCAKNYVLGAIDSLWTKKLITDNEATEAYKILNVDPEKASRVRQISAHGK
jgi:hypothetical protein